MAPKKRAPVSDSDSEGSVEEKPAAKRKVAKSKTETKSDVKMPAAKRTKTIKLTEPETTADGWTLYPPSLIFRSLDGDPGKKVAAFDLDGTLALQKTSLVVPKDSDDWILFNNTVPAKMKEVEEQGYKIVIFSNQNGIKDALKGKMAEKVTNRITNVLEAIGMPDVAVMMATNKDKTRKPETGMWDFWVQHGNGGVQPDKSKSYYVGDAAGRVSDFADSDKKFAENVGIAFKTSSDFFGEPAKKIPIVVPTESSGVNDAMANCFRDLAAAQSARGGNPHGIRALEKSAGIISAYPTKVTSGKELSKLPGIGKGSVAKIDEYLATGTVSGIEEDEAKEEKNKTTDMALKFI